MPSQLMQDIEVTCSACGCRFEVLGILEGDRAVCPGCLELCEVPGPSTLASSPAPQDQGSAPATPRKKPIAASAPPAQPQPAKKPAPSPVPAAPAKPSGSNKKWAAIVGGTVGILAGCGIVYFLRPAREEAPATPSPIETVAVAPAQPIAAVEPPAPAPPSEEPAAPPAESPERAEMRRIAMLMLERYPLVRVGEEVSLTLRNGMVYEGVLLSVDERFVTIERDNDPVQLAVNTLLPAARASVDNEFRYELIKDLVRVSLARRAENPQ